MMNENQADADIYAEVDLPADATPIPEPDSEPAPEPAAKPEPEVDIEPLTTEPTVPTEERKPRSIYHDLKDTRTSLKTERELREQAERERDEWKTKAEGKPEAKIEADDLDAFADEIGADPQVVKKMRELFLKDMPASTISPELQSKLDAFEVWQKDNGQAIATQQFETEFQSSIPALQKMFPTASAEDINSMKKEIDTLAHTTEFHDKEIDYIAFKNQEKLSTLITPHKRGLESKGRVDATNIPTDFNPNADISKMSAKELEVWEAGYKAMGKADELSTDSFGRKMIL
jgi:hypothetical protein